jgi:hypothetical protein
LFIQQVGRVLRPYAGKTDAVILDPTGVLFRHTLDGFIDLSTSAVPQEVTEKRERDEEEWAIRGEQPGYDADISGYEDVELFSVSPVRWLRTKSGVRFLYAKGELLFIAPGDEDAELWSLGVCKADAVRDGYWLATGLPLDVAEKLGADWGLGRDAFHIRSGASWRRRPTTRAQRLKALSTWGTSAHGLRHQGELYDALARQVATRTLDPVESWR